MDTRKKWGLGLVFLALAAIFTACKKSSSSSSSSGSISAATGDIANFALGFSEVTPAAVRAEGFHAGHLKPRNFSSCASFGFQTQAAPYDPSGCPNPQTDSAEAFSGTENMTFSSCTTSGYTFSGQFNLGFNGSNEIVCMNSSGVIDNVSGTIDLTSPGLNIAGNGISYSSCSLSIPLVLGMSGGVATGYAATATACDGNSFSVTAQQ